MNYFEVLPTDNHYHSDKPLTYCFDGDIPQYAIVTIELRQRIITGIIIGQIAKPDFNVKPIKNVVSPVPLPKYCFELAKWISSFYDCSISAAVKLYTPAKPVIRKSATEIIAKEATQQKMHGELNQHQLKAITEIENNPSTTVLLFGETGSGKTRVYVELAKKTLAEGKSAIILTPEITLTSQLDAVFSQHIHQKIVVLHSQLTAAKRKKLWLEILNSIEPMVIIGPRSALFSPLKNIGLIILDEAHEPAYKQDQTPRYHATRVASRLGSLCDAKVILGSATPSVEDYYLASSHSAVVHMKQGEKLKTKVDIEIIDLKNRGNFGSSQHLSKQLVSRISKTLSAKKQVIVYLNKRGSSRLILCTNCGWQHLCPNCDIPLVYHADKHQVRCHICNYHSAPPVACPNCKNIDLIYRSIGVKALADEVQKLFPNHIVKRFDGDSLEGERLDQLYSDVIGGKIDILVGTQIMAKGLDLPKLGLVGIVAAESSMGLPDFSSEERAFQLLYQIIGRVGRGHGLGNVVVQTYEPSSVVMKAAAQRDWLMFYAYCLADRQRFKFPPFSYLMKIVIKKRTESGSEAASMKLKTNLQAQHLAVEIIGPSPSFYARRGDFYYHQLIIKSKDRSDLVALAKFIPADCQVDLDPVNLL